MSCGQFQGLLHLKYNHIRHDFVVTKIGIPLRAEYKLWFRFAGNETTQETGTGCNVKSRFEFIRHVKVIVDH